MINASSLSLCAAGSASFSNLLYRQSSAASNSENIYLLFYYLVSFLFSLLMNHDLFIMPCSLPLHAIGSLCGLLNVGLMVLIARALQHGPAGLTFAFQNASSIFPHVILFFLFGPMFGFQVTSLQIVGLSCVLFGLFAAAGAPSQVSKKWVAYILGCFLMQTTILTLFQWRCLFFGDTADHVLIPFNIPESSDVWFMPGFFGMALLFQMARCFFQKAKIETKVITYGSFSGVANALSTYLLLTATKWAGPVEKGVIFPLFAVAVIVLCSIWGHFLYQEQSHKKALFLCTFGILCCNLF